MKRLAALCLAATACAPVEPPSSPDPIAFAGGTNWACDDGSAVRTQLQGTATMGLVLGDGTPLALPEVPGPTGNRYAADGWVWFTNGGTAILTQQGGQINCRVSAAPPAAPVPTVQTTVPGTTVADPFFEPNISTEF